MAKKECVIVKYVRLAENMALKSNLRIRVGAVISKIRPISAGYNQNKSHPLLLEFGYNTGANIHAEMHACIGVSAYNLKGSNITVVRLKRDGSYGLARPCKGCMHFLRREGIKRAYYSCDDGSIVKEELR